MRLCVVAYLLLAGATSFHASEPLPRLRVSDNGRCLVTESGQPVFLLGDTAWSLALRGSREVAENYLQQRAAQGFNAVTFVLFAPGRNQLTDTLKNCYGDLPFALEGNRPDPARPVTTPGANPTNEVEYDYWDHVDFVIDEAAKRGMHVFLLPTWGSGVTGTHDGKSQKEVVFGEREGYGYGRWLGERYRGRTNVVWMLGGDRAAIYGEKDFRAAFRAMGEGLADGAHGVDRQDGSADYDGILISYHTRKANPSSSEWFHQDDWLAFNSIQAWPEEQPASIARDWDLKPAKPTWLFEGRYEAYWREKYDPAQWGEWQIRQQAWQTVLGGAFGHIYGHERVFGFSFDGVDWTQHMDSPGARSMTHLAAFMRSLPAKVQIERQPDQSLVENEGKAERLTSNRITANCTPDRLTAVFYTARGDSIRIHLDHLELGPMDGAWFNPRTGKWRLGETETESPHPFVHGLGTGPGMGVREFDAPGEPGDGNDWVLMLTQVQ